MPSHALLGRAAVASSQPLATSAGLQTLLAGGNAVDAAITVAAVLSVAEPCSTGLGGDAFALFYDASSTEIVAVHGNGAAPTALTRESFLEDHGTQAGNVITVPGGVALWVDLLARYGTMKLEQVLNPAIEMARSGVVIGEKTAKGWNAGESILKGARNGDEMLVGGQRAPKRGEVWKNTNVAKVLEKIANEGKRGFYDGEIAERIVEVVKEAGGCMSLEDLKSHQTEFREAVRRGYRGWDVWEIGPPAQGIVALMGLGVMEGWNMDQISETDATHVMIEAMRMSFEKVSKTVGDANACANIKVQELLGTVGDMQKRVNMECKTHVLYGDEEVGGGGTVQFCVIDRDGNAISMVQSNYMGFGTGHVPKGLGFTLQNRGLNFSTVKGHANEVGGGRKPYHTIIPGLFTRDGVLGGVFGVMGSFMQPQGHVQVLRGLLDCGDDAQMALDRKRWRVTGEFSKVEGLDDDQVFVEQGFDEDVLEELRKRGHVVRICGREEQWLFGKGQVIVVKNHGVVEAGSDGRADGCAGVLW